MTDAPMSPEASAGFTPEQAALLRRMAAEAEAFDAQAGGGSDAPAGFTPEQEDFLRRQAAEAPDVDAELEALGGPPQGAALPAQSTTPERPGLARRILRDIGNGILEAPGQITRGALEALDATSNLAWAGAAAAGDAIGVGDSIRGVRRTQLAPAAAATGFVGGEAQSVTGGFVNEVSQFLSAFAGVGAVVRMAGVAQATTTAGRVGQSMAQGGIADTVAFNGHEQRLSNLIETVPALQNPITAFLAASPDDSEAEGRFKNALEGMIAGGLVEGLVAAVRSVRAARSGDHAGAREAAEQADAAAPPSRDPLADGAVARQMDEEAWREMTPEDWAEARARHGEQPRPQSDADGGGGGSDAPSPRDPSGAAEAAARGTEGDLRGTAEDIPEAPAAYPDGRAVHEEALVAARNATFTDDLAARTWSGGRTLGESLQGLTGNHPFLQLVLPFVRTPTNIARFVWNRTPGVNMLRAQYQADLLGRNGDEAAYRARAQMVTGGMLWAAAVTFALDGTITGGGPSDPLARRQLESTGWRPYSVRVENEDGNVSYRSFDRFDPFATFFAVAADFTEAASFMGEREVGQLTTDMMVAMARQLQNKTYLSGLTRAVAALAQPDRSGERFLQGIAGSFMPSFVNQVIRDDPYMREVRSILDAIRARTPGSLGMDPVRNVLGEAVVTPPGYGPNWISPIAQTTRPGGPQPTTPEWRHTVQDQVPDEIARQLVLHGSSMRPPAPKLYGTVDLREHTHPEATAPFRADLMGRRLSHAAPPARVPSRAPYAAAHTPLRASCCTSAP